MSSSREIKQLQKAKTKAQSCNNLREEANLCNQLGEVLARNGDFQAAIEEHRQELALSEALRDVIGCAVANRKIGECFAELGNIEAALKHQRCHLALARSVNDAAEEQRALATIGRTFLFRYESDQSQESLLQAEEAFKDSLAIVDERLEGAVPARELSEMRARLYLNLGFVCDARKDPQLCSDFIRRSVYIAEKNQLLEDLYRANFNLGSIHFRNGQLSRAVRCLEQAKDCARKMKDKYSESECYHSIGQVLLCLGDFVAARRSLKKAYKLGSQQAADREAVKRSLKQAIRGCALEEALAELPEGRPQDAGGLAEQLGDLCCKLGCYSKALDAYHTQLSSALALGRPSRELAVIHVSLAATYTDLRQHDKAVQHYRQELSLREGNPKEECETWLNIAASLEDSGQGLEQLEPCYRTALECAQRAQRLKLQCRVLRQWLSVQQRGGSAQSELTAASLAELCGADGADGESEEEEEEEEEENSELLDDSDIHLSDSEEDDLEEYDKMIPGRRKVSRWNRRNEKGETPLHRACIEGNLRGAQCLLEQGHPVNPRDFCGWTPLHEACNHGHLEIVRALLDQGANVNDPGGPLCEGITPLHDALSCGHFPVARLLVERGACVSLRNSKGDTPQDSLRQWLKTYSKHLDQETRQECVEMERLLRRAAAGNVPVSAPQTVVQPLSALQDSQLFDAENSEPLVPPAGRCSGVPCRSRGSGNLGSTSSSRGRSGGREEGWRRQAEEEWSRETAPARESSPSESDGDSDYSISPLRPPRPRLRPPAPLSPSKEAPRTAGRESASSPVSRKEEYHRAIQSLGSAKSRLLSQSLSEQERTPPAPTPSPNSRSALVPEEEYVEDDWLEDDLGGAQPRKRRRVGSGQEGRREPDIPSADTRGQESSLAAPESTPRSGYKYRPSLQNKSGCPHSPTDDTPAQPTYPQTQSATNTYTVAGQPPAQSKPLGTSLPAPIRVRVRVQDNVFLIPVPHSEAETCTVSWLCEQASQRYYQACGLQPRLSLQKEGALLAVQDLLLTVLHSNEEVLAEVKSGTCTP